MSGFRNEVFTLCKTLQSMDHFDNLRQTMTSLRLSPAGSMIAPKTEICANGIHLCAEFYGILLAFQYKLSSFPNTEHDKMILNNDEYNSIAYGQCYISRFIEMCLSELTSRNPIIGKMLSPYSFLKPIDEIPDFEIDSSIFHNAVKSFQDSTVYHALTDTNVLTAFSRIPEDAIRTLFGVLYRDIIQAPMDTVSDEIFSLKAREQGFKPNQKINPVDALQLISFKLLALREMLSAAASLIYDAMLGSELVVIDENSLIDIEKNVSNVVYSFKTILVQGGIHCPFNDILNIVFLLHVDNGKAKIHDFGRAKSSTFSFANENGDTTKLSFCVLDADLNPISNLTNH